MIKTPPTISEAFFVFVGLEALAALGAEFAAGRDRFAAMRTVGEQLCTAGAAKYRALGQRRMTLRAILLRSSRGRCSRFRGGRKTRYAADTAANDLEDLGGELLLLICTDAGGNGQRPQKKEPNGPSAEFIGPLPLADGDIERAAAYGKLHGRGELHPRKHAQRIALTRLE